MTVSEFIALHGQPEAERIAAEALADAQARFEAQFPAHLNADEVTAFSVSGEAYHFVMASPGCEHEARTWYGIRNNRKLVLEQIRAAAAAERLAA